MATEARNTAPGLHSSLPSRSGIHEAEGAGRGAPPDTARCFLCHLHFQVVCAWSLTWPLPTCQGIASLGEGGSPPGNNVSTSPEGHTYQIQVSSLNNTFELLAPLLDEEGETLSTSISRRQSSAGPVMHPDLRAPIGVTPPPHHGTQHLEAGRWA